jgi:hypothetical protein
MARKLSRCLKELRITRSTWRILKRLSQCLRQPLIPANYVISIFYGRRSLDDPYIQFPTGNLSLVQ